MCIDLVADKQRPAVGGRARSDVELIRRRLREKIDHRIVIVLREKAEAAATVDVVILG